MSLARLRGVRAADVLSALVAFALTATTFASVLVVSARPMSFQATTVQIEHATRQETVVYLEQPAVARPRVSPPSRDVSARIAPAKTEARAPTAPRDTRTKPAEASTTSSKTSAFIDPAPIFLPRYRPQPRSTLSPFDLPRVRNPFLSEQPRTRAEMDSILTELRNGVPLLAATRTPTAAERDSSMREQSRARLIPGRPPQMPGSAGMNIGLPLFSAGPSAAERRRDSDA